MNLENDYLVSVCVPVYKVEKYIERCAWSLFEQTYENIEFVFVDDCSPDNSIAVVKRVAEQYPHRKPNVRIIRHKTNSGLGQARNTGVCEAKGDFILHVDSDDYIDTNVVKRLVEKQKETEADIVKYPKKNLFVDKTVVEKVKNYSSSQDLLVDMLNGKTAANVCGQLIRTSLYRDYGIQVEGGVNQSEDLQVIPRLLFYARTIATINDAYYYYDRTRETSYCNTMTEESYKQILTTKMILDRFFRDKNRPDLAQKMWKQCACALCTSKIVHAKFGQRDLFYIANSMIAHDKQMAGCHLPLKETIVSRVNSYSLLRMLMLMKKAFRI